MGVLRHRHHSLTAFAFLLFASAAAVITLSFLSSGFQGEGDSKELGRILTQKRLDGLGSSPPSCRSKCGNCSPCNPVHVPIHPGFSFPQEYYPEAWRCKCGNKLFMP